MNKTVAENLCGVHIGMGIEVQVIVEDNRRWNAEEKKFHGDVVYGWEFATISMITHKKNGDVNVRTSRGERSYEAQTVVSLDD